jgi:hypothetical protein
MNRPHLLLPIALQVKLQVERLRQHRPLTCIGSSRVWKTQVECGKRPATGVSHGPSVGSVTAPHGRNSTWPGCSRMCRGQNLAMGTTPAPHRVVLVMGCWHGATAGEVEVLEAPGRPPDTRARFSRCRAASSASRPAGAW